MEEAFVLEINESIPFEGERDTSEVGRCCLPPLAKNGRPLVVRSKLKNVCVERRVRVTVYTRLPRPKLLKKMWDIGDTSLLEGISLWQPIRRQYCVPLTNAKIKDDIMCWQVRNFLLKLWHCLSSRQGKNITLDMLTRAMCTTLSQDSLDTLAPWVTLSPRDHKAEPATLSKQRISGIEGMTGECSVCCECKPEYHRRPKVPLMSATHWFYMRESLILKVHYGNKYFLNVDWFARFPSVFPCPYFLIPS
mgnify:CR=1 FL=1